MARPSGRIRAALDEFDVFVRDKRAVDILHKVVAADERPFEELVSGDTPFGLATNFSGYVRDVAPKGGQVRLYANVGTKRVTRRHGPCDNQQELAFD